MDEERRAAIIRDVATYSYIEPLREYEFTRAQYAQETGMTDTSASNRLDVLVQKGKLNVRKVLIDGHHQNAYSRPEDSASSGER